MLDIAVRPAIPAMDTRSVDVVRRLEAASLAEMPQVEIRIDHVLHAGMYARTAFLPAGAMITGVEIRVETLLIVHGDAIVWIGADDGSRRLSGFNVLAASAGRKQAFVAETDTHLTMIFPTSAKTVEQAEAEFTAEAHMLQSRRV